MTGRRLRRVEVANKRQNQNVNPDSGCLNHDSSFITVNNSFIHSLRHGQSQSAYIQAELGNCSKYIQTKILIDTGADYDVIDAEFYQKLKENDIRCKLVAPTRRPPVAANNQPMKMLGDCELDIKLTAKNCKSHILQRVKFCVLGNLSTPCILGISTLRMLGLFVKGDTIKISGTKICLLTEEYQDIEYVDSFVDDHGAKWGVYSDPLELQEKNQWLSANHVDSLHETYSEGNSTAYEPREMKPGKYLVFLYLMADPPQKLRIDKTDQTRVRLNGLKNCKSEPKRKLIPDQTIEEIVKKSNFSTKGKQKLKEILRIHRAVFSSSSFDVGAYKGSKATLKFKNNEQNPVFVPVRRIPHSLREWLSTFLVEMEEKKIIKKCKASTWNSPLFLVEKKDKSWRPVSDFRALNKQLEDVYFPIPFITDLLDSLHGTKYFSSVDLRSGFYNIELDDESTECTAFSALGQTYRYLRLPQGIKSSPIIFQQIMTELFHDDPSCKVYMDDVLVASKSEEEALKDINRLLKRFIDHGFLLNPAKCIFGSTKLEYLGYEISQDGWTINKSKVEDLLRTKPPVSTTEVRSFTGLCNFYLNCIPNLQRTLQPLHQLTGKKKFVWNEECQIAFDQARDKLAKATIMSFPSMKKDDTYFLTTDASDSGWGGCLSQYQSGKGFEVPLSFSSGSFTNSEINWPIKEKEMFSFVKNLRNYETYLFGRRFVWRTDNRALSFFLSSSVVKSTALKNVSPKVSRWIDYVNEFDFAIEHHAGTTDVMAGPDYLSRKSTIASLNDSKLDLNNIWLYSGCSIADIISSQVQDANLKNFRKGYSPLKSKKLWKVSTENGLMVALRNGKEEKVIVMPEELIDNVLEFYHGIQHTGVVTMAKSMSKRFYIPNMTGRIRHFVSQCIECIRNKSRKSRPDQPILQTSSKHPWMAVNADLIGPFPKSYKQNQYCLVVIDNLTRWVEIRAIPTKHAESVADAFMNIFHVRGLPLSILCDNGKEFYNLGLKKMFEKLGTNLQYTTPYRPQSNGLTERCNQKIKKLLRLWNVHDATWDTYIGPIQFLINNEYNRVLNMSAFQAIHGWTLSRMDFVSPGDIHDLQITEFDSKQWAKQHSARMAKSLRELFINDVKQKTERYQKLRKVSDKSLPETSEGIPNGAHVLIQFPQAPGTSKLMSNWKGTYVVIQQVDKNVYLVSHVDGQRRKMLIHRSRIRVLPRHRKEDTMDIDGSEAVTKTVIEPKIHRSRQLGDSNEHSTEVKTPARDYSDKQHVDLGMKIPKSHHEPGSRKVQKSTKKKIPAPNRHGMTLRKRK